MGFVVLLGILLLIWEYNLIYGILMLFICSYIVVGFEVYIKKYKLVWYFIFVWSILVIGVFIGMLSLVGVVLFNMFIIYCFQVVVFCEVGLFLIVLMEKSCSCLENDVFEVIDELCYNMELIEE